MFASIFFTNRIEPLSLEELQAITRITRKRMHEFSATRLVVNNYINWGAEGLRDQIKRVRECSDADTDDFKRIHNFFNMGTHHMILRFTFSLVFILSCFGPQEAFAMDIGRGGHVPPLDQAAESSARAQREESYSCIPSSAARCNDACCRPISKLSVVVAKQEPKKDSEFIEKMSKN